MCNLAPSVTLFMHGVFDSQHSIYTNPRLNVLFFSLCPYILLSGWISTIQGGCLSMSRVRLLRRFFHSSIINLACQPYVLIIKGSVLGFVKCLDTMCLK